MTPLIELTYSDENPDFPTFVVGRFVGHSDLKCRKTEVECPLCEYTLSEVFSDDAARLAILVDEADNLKHFCATPIPSSHRILACSTCRVHFTSPRRDALR